MTPHFTYTELIHSDVAERYGIVNVPEDVYVLGNLHLLAAGLERCRKVLGKPMVITSGYRCPRLNKLVRGAGNSAHQFGLAADFYVPGKTGREVCLTLKDHAEIKFDQLIQEGSWTHIAFPAEGKPPRGVLLTARFQEDAPTTYTVGIV